MARPVANCTARFGKDTIIKCALIKEYQKGSAPVIVDEDRYELYTSPAHPRYFFRRLTWASLLSGGAATYGGLKTYEAFDGDLAGVQGYFDHADTLKGENGFVHIHRFFDDAKLNLVGMRPDDPALSVGSAHGRSSITRKPASSISRIPIAARQIRQTPPRSLPWRCLNSPRRRSVYAGSIPPTVHGKTVDPSMGQKRGLRRLVTVIGWCC